MDREVAVEELEKEISARDEKDKGRDIAPLKKAKDAVVIDTTDIPVPRVLEKMMRHIESAAA